MAIPYKVIARRSPMDPESAPHYYPQLTNMGQTATLETIAYDMKEASSLSIGDIKSVLANFVVAMRRELYNGHSVNIADFGVFRLTAHSKGVDVKAECNSKLFMNVRIAFRASSSVRPSLTSKSLGDVMNFYDLEKAMEEKKDNSKPPVNP